MSFLSNEERYGHRQRVFGSMRSSLATATAKPVTSEKEAQDAVKLLEERGDAARKRRVRRDDDYDEDAETSADASRRSSESVSVGWTALSF